LLKKIKIFVRFVDIDGASNERNLSRI